MKKPTKLLLAVQAVFTIMGAISSVLMVANIFTQDSDFIDCLNAAIYCIVYLYAIIYSVFKYKDADLYFELFAYCYAALLGVLILYSGRLIRNSALSDPLAFMINTVNLICFANVIKFTDHLDDRKVALAYLGTAVILKFAAELFLIVLSFDKITPLNIMTALSVPILGATLLLAYAHRYGEE